MSLLLHQILIAHGFDSLQAFEAETVVEVSADVVEVLLFEVYFGAVARNGHVIVTADECVAAAWTDFFSRHYCEILDVKCMSIGRWSLYPAW